MTRLVVLACLAATLMFAAFATTARAVGERSYRTPTLLTKIAACATPCWNGITLGETTVAAARTILRADGYIPVNTTSESDLILRNGTRDCWATLIFFDDRVTSLRFAGCEPVAIGDLMLALGNPNSIIPTGGVGDWWRWQDNLIEAATTGKVTPRSTVTSLGFDAPGQNAPSGRAWHGFIPFWRYCRMERVPYFCVGIPPTAA